MSWLEDKWDDFKDSAKDVARAVFPVVFLPIDLAKESAEWLVNKLIDLPAAPERDALVTRQGQVAKIPVLYGQRMVGGVLVFPPRVSGASNEYLWQAFVLSEGPIDGVVAMFMDDVISNDEQWGDTVQYTVHLGTDSQTADEGLMAAFPELWTEDHRLRGLAYVVVRLTFDDQIYTGVPRITFLVNGRTVYDPRTDTTAYSRNPALCIRDYLTNPLYGRGLPSDMVDGIEAAANTCDAVMPAYDEGPNIPVFQCNGLVDTEREIHENVSLLLTSCHGNLPFTGGKYRLVIDEDAEPVFAFTPDNLIGAFAVGSGSKRTRLNRVKIRYANPSANWQGDLAILDSPELREQDNGLLLEREIQFPFETNRYRSVFHAEVAIKRSRQGLSYRALAAPEAVKVLPTSVVTVTDPSLGWDEKLFRVIGLGLRPDGLVSLSLSEHEPTVYDRSVPVEAPTPPDTNLPNPRIVLPPTDFVVTSSPIVGADGTVIPRLVASWTAPADIFVTSYEVDFKPTAEETWVPAASPSSRTATTAEITPVRSGVAYDVRVRSVNASGFYSEYVTGSATASGNVVPPEDPLALSATAVAGGIRLDWTDLSDPTRREYKIVVGASYGAGTVIGRPVRSPFLWPQPIGPATYQFFIGSVSFEPGVESDAQSSTSIEIEAPDTPNVSHQVLGEIVELTWPSAETSFPIDYYLVNGLEVRGRVYQERITWVGDKEFAVVAVDVAGNESDTGTETVTVLAINAPTGLTTFGLTYAIRLGLTYSKTAEFEALEIWMAETNDRSAAGKIADTGIAVHTISGLPLIATRYFWIRVRNRFQVFSDWYPSGATSGVAGSPSTDPTDYLEALTGHITLDQFSAPVADAVGSIASIEAQIAVIESDLAELTGIDEFDEDNTYNEGDLTRYDGRLYLALQDMLTPPAPNPTNGAYWELIGDYASLGEAVSAHAVALLTLNDRVDETEDGLEAVASELLLLEAVVEDESTGLSSKASVTELSTAISNVYGAAASSFTGMTAEFENISRHRDNAIVNPWFEQGLAPHVVVAASGGSWAVDTVGSAAYAGTKVLRYNSSGQSAPASVALNGALSTRVVHIEAKAGDRVRASIWAKMLSGTAHGVILRLQGFAANGTAVGASSNTQVTPTSTWAQIVCDHLAVDGSSPVAYVGVQVIVLTGSGSGVHYFDAAHLERLDATLIADVATKATVSQLNTAVANIYGASVTAFSQIDARFSSTDANIATRVTVTQLNTAISTVYAASVTAFSQIDARFTSTDANINTRATVTQLNTAISNEQAARATAVNTVSARIANAEEGPPWLLFGFAADLESWTGAASTQVWQLGGTILWTATAANPTFTRNLAAGTERFTGGNFTKVRARVRRVSGTGAWEGHCYYSTAGHGTGNSGFRKQIPAPANPSAWNILEWDMAALTAGGNDWINNEIQSIRLDLVSDAGSAWQFDWIAIAQAAVTPLGAELTSLGATVTTISSAVAEASGYLAASYSLVLQAGQYISGYRATVDSVGNSSFDILANRFRVVNQSSTGDIKVPFVVGNINGASAVGINGDLIVDGSILARSILTSSITIGTLGGAGALASQSSVTWSTQVTGTGKPADNATRNTLFKQATLPASPVDGDIWHNTGYSVSPYVVGVTYLRVAGAWQNAANYITNTNELVDGAALGQTALWTSVSGSGKPADNATRNTLYKQATLPASPVNGDIWHNTGYVVSPYVVGVTYLRVAGVWQNAANYITNTNELVDGAALGQTALWTSVSGSGKPADNATRNTLYKQATLPASPVNGDIWHNTGYVVSPYVVGVTYLRVAGVWQNAANYITNTNELVDGAALGQTAIWTSVSGAGRPADNADVTLTKLDGGLNVTGAGITLSLTAAIRSLNTTYNGGTPGFFLGFSGGGPRLFIGNPSGSKLLYNGSALTLETGVSGERMDFNVLGNRLRFFDATAERVRIGTGAAVDGLSYYAQLGVTATATGGLFAQSTTGNGVVGQVTGAGAGVAGSAVGTGGKALVGFAAANSIPLQLIGGLGLPTADDGSFALSTDIHWKLRFRESSLWKYIMLMRQSPINGTQTVNAGQTLLLNVPGIWQISATNANLTIEILVNGVWVIYDDMGGSRGRNVQVISNGTNVRVRNTHGAFTANYSYSVY